jgi:hypothetical protein
MSSAILLWRTKMHTYISITIYTDIGVIFWNYESLAYYAHTSTISHRRILREDAMGSFAAIM